MNLIGGLVEPWGATLWSSPLYRFLFWLLLVECGLIIAQIAWLLRQTWILGQMAIISARFEEELGSVFFDAVDDAEARRDWVRRARTFNEAVVRTFIEGYIQRTDGEYRERVVRIYRDLGLLWLDLEDLRSPAWQIRMIALRRMFLAATPLERDALLERKDDIYAIRIMAARVLARVGTSEDLVEVLQDLHLPRRLMEQPLVAMLHAMPITTYEGLMRGWHRLKDPRLRRIVLINAAHVVPSSCLAWVPRAAQAAEIEVRIGACVAAGQLPSTETRDLLLRLLQDPEWEVRAQAASALGQLGDTSTLEVLGDALHDKSFWVRQNAAFAVRNMGTAGLALLSRIVDGDADMYARDAASQELQRHELMRQALGGGA
jgi:hypothetical protein